MPHIIAPKTGTAFELAKGRRLKIIDPEGEQVADLACYNKDDTSEFLSSGRSIDYASKLLFTREDKIYSNQSQVMLTIEEDTVGRHDFLFTPCSEDTFRIIYGHERPHHGCYGNLKKALAPYGIRPDQIPVTFNVFMNVRMFEDGKVKVEPTLSKAGDYCTVRAEMDLIVGLTACASGQANNFAYKPIHYEIFD